MSFQLLILHPINRKGEDSFPGQALIFSGTFSTTQIVHFLTARIISTFTVSYCKLCSQQVESPLEHANSSLLCMLFEFPFDTLHSINKQFLEAIKWSGLGVFKVSLVLSVFRNSELVQHEQRPQHVFRRYFNL